MGHIGCYVTYLLTAKFKNLKGMNEGQKSTIIIKILVVTKLVVDYYLSLLIIIGACYIISKLLIMILFIIVKDLANNPLPAIPTSRELGMPADNRQPNVKLPLLRQVKHLNNPAVCRLLF